MPSVRNILLSLSGADRDLLLTEAPRDRAKYEGIGGAVLLTASMAGLASAIAVRIAFDLHIILAILFGALWGLAMLSLDRWLVAANQRQDRAISTLMLAVPRVLLALIVGIVMSTPLVLQIFDGEIDAQIIKMQQAEKSQLESRLEADKRYASLEEDLRANERDRQEVEAGVTAGAIADDPDVKRLQAEVQDLNDQLRQVEQQLVCERSGGSGCSGKIGIGPAYEENLEVKRRVEGDLETAEAALATARKRAGETLGESAAERAAQVRDEVARLEDLEKEREGERLVGTARIESNDGLLARIEALHDLGKERRDLEVAHLVLLLFLTAIECLPVIVKLLLSFAKPTLYELKATALDAEELRQAAVARDAAHELQLMAVARDWQLQEDRARTELHIERQRLRHLVDAEEQMSLRLQQERLDADLAAAPPPGRASVTIVDQVDEVFMSPAPAQWAGPTLT